jgi:hypothetical protein
MDSKHLGHHIYRSQHLIITWKRHRLFPVWLGMFFSPRRGTGPPPVMEYSSGQQIYRSSVTPVFHEIHHEWCGIRYVVFCLYEFPWLRCVKCGAARLMQRQEILRHRQNRRSAPSTSLWGSKTLSGCFYFTFILWTLRLNCANHDTYLLDWLLQNGAGTKHIWIRLGSSLNFTFKKSYFSHSTFIFRSNSSLY